jgi:hypothetical protein
LAIDYFFLPADAFFLLRGGTPKATESERTQKLQAGEKDSLSHATPVPRDMARSLHSTRRFFAALFLILFMIMYIFMY